MPIVRSQGKERAEPERHDEMSDGVPGPLQVDPRDERTALGRFVKGASRLPTLGGKARKGETQLSHRVANAPALGPYAKRARFFRKALVHELATVVGGGHCGIMSSALVKLAAESMALAEAALERGEIEAHRKLGESARLHMVYARELCAKDAESRKANAPWVDPLAGFLDLPNPADLTKADDHAKKEPDE